MKRLLVFLLALLLVFSVACTKDAGKTLPDEQNDVNATDVEKGNEKQQPVETVEVTLYYSDKDARGLYPEKRQIPIDKENDAQYIAQELFNGTKKEDLVNTIPAGTKINSCTVSQGLCTIDLSSDFVSKQGTANEQLAIYSVVNTLCALDGVDEVQFLIDGEKVMIYGSYIFDEPFSADTSIVR